MNQFKRFFIPSKLLFKKLLLLNFILLFTPCSHASFEKAMELYSQGKFEEAKKSFEIMAAIGDRTSLFNLGIMHYRGESTESDPLKAYALIKIASEDYDDPQFSSIKTKIFDSFSDTEKTQAEELYAVLDDDYNVEKNLQNLFPTPLDDEDCAPEVKRIREGKANYPTTELNSGRMGIVQLDYTISPEGYPRDVVVTSSTSKNFASAAVKGTQKRLYEPPTNQIPIYGHRFRHTFVIDDSSGGKVRTKKLSQELDEIKVAAESGSPIYQYAYALRLNVFRSFKEYLQDLDLQYRKANEWYTKAAQNGVPQAQFEIGKNMMEGRGCEVDLENGIKWVKASAVGGYSPAQRLLAQNIQEEKDISDAKSYAAIDWLRNAANSNDHAAKVLLAWELTTSASGFLRDGEEALNLLNIKKSSYHDEIRINETKAAAYAELGDFKKAIKFQKKAIKAVKKRGWDIPLISQRLALYETNQPYRGSYY